VLCLFRGELTGGQAPMELGAFISPASNPAGPPYGLPGYKEAYNWADEYADVFSPVVFNMQEYIAMYNLTQLSEAELKTRWRTQDLDEKHFYPNCTQASFGFSPNAYYRYNKDNFNFQLKQTGHCYGIVKQYLSEGIFQTTTTWMNDREAAYPPYSKASRQATSLFPSASVYGWKTESETPGNLVRKLVPNPEGVEEGCMSPAMDNSACLVLKDFKFPVETMSGMPTYTLSFWYRGTTLQSLQSAGGMVENFNILRYGRDPDLQEHDNFGMLVTVNEKTPSISLTDNAHLLLEVQLKYRLMTVNIPVPFGFADQGNGVAGAAQWTHVTLVVDRNGRGSDPVEHGVEDQNTAISVYKDGVLLHRYFTPDGPVVAFPAQPQAALDAGGPAPRYRFLFMARDIPNQSASATGMLADITYYPGSPMNARLVKTAYEISRDRFKFEPVAEPPTPDEVAVIKTRIAAIEAASSGEELTELTS